MIALCLLCFEARAQSALDCGLPSPSFATGAPNIFNAQQEQDLGDALAELEETDLKLAPPAADDQLTRTGERLLAALPPSGLHYRFRVYDSGEVNGFSLAGGRVYISRKLIAAVKNEDELAGVLAHEIGHISTHQTAIEVTRSFRIRMGVTQVGDRADIFAKVHKWMSTPAKDSEDQDTEKKDQLAADHVALYAMVRAGYAPDSFSSFLNEIMMNKGKTGNAITDFFGITHEASQRYRSALKLIAALPQSCRAKQPGVNEAFTAWQRGIVEERVKSVAEGAGGDRPLKLDPPLRPSLWRIRFSQDGRYVLAQDEAGVSVIDKIAGKVLFRIDALDAEEAQFTPDSKSVVFNDDNLRVERWDVASGTRTSVKEMVVFDGCDQTLLAPDGKTLACVNIRLLADTPRIGLRLIDVESGQTIFDKPKFYDLPPDSRQYLLYVVAWAKLAGSNIVNLEVSQDGKYLVAFMDQRMLAYDLEHRQQVVLGGALKESSLRSMCFYGPDQVFVIREDLKANGLRKTQIASFPDGRVLEEGEIGKEQVDSTSKGRTLIAGPLKDYAVGILDPDKHQFRAESKFNAIDAWDNYVAMEDNAGGLFLGEMGGSGGGQDLALPMGTLPRPRAALFSADGKYLAVSLRTRAALWDLETGKQATLIRPFRSAWMDHNDRLFGMFPKYLDKEPTVLELLVTQPGAKTLSKLEDHDWQYHNLQIRFKPMGKDKDASEIWHHATLEVKKMETQAVAWSRDYAHETPACWQAEDDRLVLAWDLSNDTARAEIKNNPALQREAAALKNSKKGLLIETVGPETGAPLEQVVIPEIDLSGGWNDERLAMVSGEFVLVRGEHGNTVIYRMDTGVKVGEFFGTVVATDAGSSRIVAVNREEEILVVDEQSGKELKRFTLGSPIRLARIVNNQKKELMVLTADQVVHRLPLPE
jgi:WD40 repeat protein